MCATSAIQLAAAARQARRAAAASAPEGLQADRGTPLASGGRLRSRQRAAESAEPVRRCGPTAARRDGNADDRDVAGEQQRDVRVDKPASAEDDDAFESEVAEVMKKLLARARAEPLATPRGVGSAASGVKSYAGQASASPLSAVPPAAVAMKGVDTASDDARPSDFAAVAGLQAKVEQRAMQLRRDLELLAEQKRELLQREAGEVLNRQAEEELRACEGELGERTEEAVGQVWAAFDSAREDYEAVVAEIDEQLAVLEQARVASAAAREQMEETRRQGLDAIVEWVADAKAAQRERLARRAAMDMRWVRQHVAEILSEGAHRDDGNV
eukprot:gnl/TRDRNA2_/TRDRNA2_189250_c0_seq1.p1 gnl/TRDRNA2_/TRDRNA2_189250_c0~~gnl/TRDRNA2_/TRDRNA2_189250_c0_seq1.p1  ORF type:complete len:346 (-),score=76.48 gnl/TRDRNA2_/TRDRNA2_189250_c0_seq1:10-993(-)